MDDGTGSPLRACIIFLLFIIINGILYGFGAAILKVSESEIDKKAQEGDKKAAYLLHMSKEPSIFADMIQVVATLFSILAGYFGVRGLTPYVYRGLSQSFLAQYISDFILSAVSVALVVILTLVLLLAFGVVSARKIAVCHPAKSVYRYVGVVRICVTLFQPLILFISLLSDIVVRLFGIDPGKLADDVTEEEIISIVDEAHEQGVIEESEAEMIQNIIEFSDKSAKDIMTHRKNINALDETMLLSDAVKQMLDGINSRYPVYSETIDNILGIIYLKDAMKELTYHNTGDMPIGKIANLIRQVAFIPETRSINDIFKGMQAKKIHIAIVIDEYGQTAGLVAMEDILEEIVGNILDEYDEDDNFIQPLYDDTIIMDGLTPLEQVEEVLDIDLEKEECETLNGYLTSLLGHIPTSQDIQVEAEGYSFCILAVDNNTIQKVRVEKLPEKDEEKEKCQDIQNSLI